MLPPWDAREDMSRHGLLVTFGVAVFAILGASPPSLADNGACLECHGDPAESGGRKIVDAKVFAASVHGTEEIGCTDCHSDLDGVDEFPHDTKLAKVACSDCHDEAEAVWKKSAHARQPHSKGVERLGAGCADCHGDHDIRPRDHIESRTNHFNVAATCGRCHGDEDKMKAAGVPGGAVANEYADSIHGRGVTKAGLSVAPDCTTCHGNHDIHGKNGQDGHRHPKQIAKTCAKCHQGVARRFETSSHARAFSEGKAAPTCTTCHNAHHIMGHDDKRWRLDVVGDCGGCHEESIRTYRDTFHGQVTALGYTRVATCADCHGAHEIVGKDDPRSKVSAGRRLETCRSCHPEASEAFADYDPHANPHDSDRDPLLHVVAVFMEWLLIIVFGFFALHTLLWFVRALLDRRKHKREGHSGHSEGKPQVHVRRFDLYHRVVHLCLMSSFLGLAATGLPLRFADEEWAAWIAKMLGGFGVAGTLHRFFAVVLIGAFAAHLGRVFWRVVIKRERGMLWGPRSLVPQPRDLREIYHHMRWFLGLGKRPVFDRYTYWEKFDYWAVFWGMAIIGGSGLVLWFPEFFTSFLPGKVLNLAMVIHSEEALLAVGFIFTVHFFNGHLRPGKFPMDMVIFTGTVTEEELAEERPAEYERVKADGTLERLRTDAPDQTARRLGRTIGTLAVLTGVTIMVLILIAVWG